MSAGLRALDRRVRESESSDCPGLAAITTLAPNLLNSRLSFESISPYKFSMAVATALTITIPSNAVNVLPRRIHTERSNSGKNNERRGREVFIRLHLREAQWPARIAMSA